MTTETIATTKTHTFRAEVIRNLVNSVSFASDAESTRTALQGMLFTFENNAMTAYASDGRRLASRTIEGDMGELSGEQMVLTRETMTALSNIGKTATQVVATFDYATKQSDFSWNQRNGTKHVGNTGDLRFPDLDYIVRTESDCQKMRHCRLDVDLTQRTTDDITDAVVVDSRGTLTRPSPTWSVSSSGTDIGEVAVNWGYLTEWLDSVSSWGSKQARFYMTAPDSPVYGFADGARYVLMPVMIK